MPASKASKKESPQNDKDQLEQHGFTSEMFPIVGIGASAGGLDAFKKFFQHMPPANGMAFVLIQHLDPHHESMMAELLSRSTEMQVVQIKDNMQVEPNRVYLIPPNKTLTLEGLSLKLNTFTERRGLRMPIDTFFRSQAECQGEKSISIILSGTGSDGTLGIKAVKAAGGMCMAQDPDEAAHGGMPRSAISTGLVDFVLPVEKMPGELLKYVQHPYFDGNNKEPLPEDEEAQLQIILKLLKKAGLHDFKCYKRGTIIRRIERRMGIKHLDDLRAYRRLLEKDPLELEELSKDLLISVTNFFRDREVFDILKNDVLPQICQKADQERPIRIWIPGAATGEEAFSVAMLVFETLQNIDKSNISLQIFATDIDKSALQRARKSRYPETIQTDVSEERLKRFFDKNHGQYEVKNFVREAITFSVHNLISDPPFSKIDLISCRNLLIYLNPEVQQRIISLFHFSLKPDGILLLGGAESIGKQTDLFECLNKKWRFYKKLSIKRPPQFHFPVGIPSNEHIGYLQQSLQPELSLKKLAERQMLKHFSPSGVIINGAYEILHCIGQTDRFLKLPEGKPNMVLTSMVTQPVRNSLRSLLHKIVQENVNQVTSVLRMPQGDEEGTKHMQLGVRRISLEGQQTPLYLVSFQPLPSIEPPPMLDADGKMNCENHERVIRQLEKELQTTREDLESTIEQLETTNEELKAGNEEVMSMNEEFQSTNEELETSKEELQSLNEELTTLNNELQEKVAELETTTNDLNNLMASSEVATLFLDTDLHIKLFTEPVRKIFHLLPGDIDRPFKDFERGLSQFTITEDALQVLENLTQVEKEIRVDGDRWYQQRVLPYRTKDNRIEGVVITFTDITKIKTMAEEAERKATFLQMMSNNQPARMAYTDKAGRFQYVNDTYLEWVQRPREQIIGKTVREVLGDELYTKIDHYIQQALAGEQVHYEEVFTYPDKKNRHVMVDYTPHHDRHGNVEGFFTLITDITERKKAEENSAHLAAIVASSADAIISKDFEGKILTWNKGAETTFGYRAEEIIGRHMRLLYPDSIGDDMPEKLSRIRRGESLASFDSQRRTRDGRLIDVRITLSPISDQTGKAMAVSMICHDITELKQIEQALRKSEALHRSIGETVPFGTWTADPEGNCTMVTRPFLEMSGMPLDEILEFGWMERVPESDREELGRAWMHCVETGENWNYEYRFTGGDGKLRHIMTIGRPVRDQNGKIQFWAGFHLDNTQRKQLEIELQSLNEMLELKIEERTAELEANMQQLRHLALELTQTEQRERQRLAAVLHNDLQQLLAAAKLRLSRLHNKLKIDTNITSLNEIQDLLDQSASTARNLASELRPPILNEADLPESLQWLATWFAEKFDLHIDLDITEDISSLKVPTEIDIFLFEAARELLFNVVKHANVSQAQVNVYVDDEHCLHLTVHDKGKGANDQTCLESKADTGMGLASIRDRLQLIGGDFMITTKKGEGFLAEIMVPLSMDLPLVCSPFAEEDSECLHQEHEPAEGEQKDAISILLADDHAIVREGLRLTLQENEDFTIIGEAGDGQQAMELAGELTPNVVIMDINMPKLSGVEATRAIKNENPQICVVGLSINEDEGSVRAMLNAGACACLPKSGPTENLIRTIRSCPHKKKPDHH